MAFAKPIVAFSAPAAAASPKSSKVSVICLRILLIGEDVGDRRTDSRAGQDGHDGEGNYHWRLLMTERAAE